MKQFIGVFMCLFGIAGGALADFSPPNPYVGAFGFEVFADRIQNVHMWRRTQELMQEVSLTAEVLLRLGWSGLPEAGNNWSTRLAVARKDRPDLKVLLDDADQYANDRKVSLADLEGLIFDPNHQMQTADTLQGRGVCYDTTKGDCFEDETRPIQGIFGDLYGAGTRYDKELLALIEDDDLKDFQGGKLTRSEIETTGYEPFMPVSAKFYQQEATSKSLAEWQGAIMDRLQVKGQGDKDKHLIGLNQTRVSYRKNSGTQGLATVFKNIMNLSEIDVTQTIFKKMLNTAFGLRGLIQLNTHMALYQQGLINTLIANQSLGDLRFTGSSVATKTTSKGEAYPPGDYSDVEKLINDLNNPDFLKGPMR